MVQRQPTLEPQLSAITLAGMNYQIPEKDMRIGKRKGGMWTRSRKGTQENRLWASKSFHHHHFAPHQPFQITTCAPQVCNGHILDAWSELCSTEVWPSPWWIHELGIFCIMIREKKSKWFHHQPRWCSYQDLESLLTPLLTYSSQPITC